MSHHLADVIEEFLIRPAVLSKYTRASYKKDLAHFLAFVGNRPVGDIAARDIDLYWRSLKNHTCEHSGKPYSCATIQKKTKTLVALFNMCVKRGYIDHAPTSELSFPNIVYDLEKKAMPPELLARMLDGVWDHSQNPERDYFIIVALASMALRRGDLCQLKLGDVDTGRRIITLRNRKGGRFQKLPIPIPFVDAYRAWLGVRPR